MIEVLDILEEEFPQIVISDEDKNGKKNELTRWFFVRNKKRYHNVFIEVWEHMGYVDVVMYRDLMTPEENARAVLDGKNRINNKRGRLRFPNMTKGELFDFIRSKVNLYCERMD